MGEFVHLLFEMTASFIKTVLGLMTSLLQLSTEGDSQIGP